MQLFTTLAKTTLASSLAGGATSASLTNGSIFQAPTGGDYEALFLLDDADAPTNWEEIHVTARSGNTITITRTVSTGGTPPNPWPAGTVVAARLSAGTLARFLQVDGDPIELDNNGDAKGGESINIQRGRGLSALVASGFRGTLMCANGGMASGYQSFAFGANEARAQGDYSGILGEGNITGDYSFGMGFEAYVFADYAMGFGFSPDHAIQNAVQMVGIPMLADTDGFYITGGGALTGDRLTAQMCTSQAVLASKVVTVSTTGDDKAVIQLPTGVHFIVRAIGFLAVTGSGVVTGPNLAAGTTTGGTELLGSTPFSELSDAYDYDEFPVDTKLAVAGSIYLSCKNAASAAMTGRFYVLGVMVED